jgi:hypothetical protein
MEVSDHLSSVAMLGTVVAVALVLLLLLLGSFAPRGAGSWGQTRRAGTIKGGSLSSGLVNHLAQLEYRPLIFSSSDPISMLSRGRLKIWNEGCVSNNLVV